MVKIDHIRLAVTSWEASRDWYITNFGFKVEFQIPDGGAEKRGVAAIQDDAGLTIFLEEIAHTPIRCTCIFYFQVGDVDELYCKLRSKGVSFSRAPQQFFWGYGAELTDLNGYAIRIWDERSMNAN